jgi:transcriptional regulator with XRE-family HTH domain
MLSRRKTLGLRQEDLAVLSGLSQAQISRYESGDNDPTGQALIALANVLKTSVDWLLGITEDPTPGIRESELSARERAVLAAWRGGDIIEAIKVIVSDQ